MHHVVSREGWSRARSTFAPILSRNGDRRNWSVVNMLQTSVPSAATARFWSLSGVIGCAFFSSPRAGESGEKWMTADLGLCPKWEDKRAASLPVGGRTATAAVRENPPFVQLSAWVPANRPCYILLASLSRNQTQRRTRRHLVRCSQASSRCTPKWPPLQMEMGFMFWLSNENLAGISTPQRSPHYKQQTQRLTRKEEDPSGLH